MERDEKILLGFLGAASIGAVGYVGLGVGISAGVAALGKGTLSFFNPALAKTAGSYANVAAVGALSYFPDYLMKCFLSDPPIHSQFAQLLHKSFALLISCGAVLCSALLLGTPVILSIVCVMILPLIMAVFTHLMPAINEAIQSYDNAAAYRGI